MSRPKAANDVYLFKLQNGLKEKVGGPGAAGRGGLPKGLLKEADAQLHRTAVEFQDWAQDYLKNLSALCDEARKAPEDGRRQHIDRINMLAQELRGQGGIFGYGLITTTGKYLYDLTRLGCPTDDTTVDIIKAHVDTMRVAFRDRVTGDGGEVGRALIAGLQDAIRKYAAKHKRVLTLKMNRPPQPQPAQEPEPESAEPAEPAKEPTAKPLL